MKKAMATRSSMIRRWLSVLAVIVLMTGCVSGSAAGLLPSTSEMFGDYVASVPAILGRAADTDVTTGNQRVLTFSQFTLVEYSILSNSLTA